MGQYKVPQDVEAEDKIIGPLTLKQFIYAVIGVAWGGISWVLFKGVLVVFILVGLPPAILFIMLGVYRRSDQPFEVYLLAVMAYFGQPRKRLWEKEPIEEVFKVEAPIIKAEIASRDPREVIGQLDRLAKIVDTRGYSSKQPELQEPSVALITTPDDRLTQPIAPLSTAEPTEVQMSDDMLDFDNNPTAQNLNLLIADQARVIRQEAVAKMHTDPPARNPQPPASTPTPQTTSTQTPPTSQVPPTLTETPANPLASMLKLAMENTDLTVSQVAAQAARQQPLTEGQSVNLRTPPKQ